MAPPPKIKPTPKSARERNCCKPDNTPSWKIGLECATFVIAIVGLYVFWGQWNAAKTANDINANNFRASQRAWIGMDEKSTITISGINSPIHWNLVFRNFGNSPALRFRLHTHLYPDQTHFTFPEISQGIHDLRLDSSEESDATIFNGQTISNAADSKSLTSKPGNQMIANHTQPLVIGGRITYYDIFDIPHHYLWCRVYNAPPTLGEAGLTICPGVPDETD
jgi:hypothetical protein